jgi:hypothetical protein
MVDPVLEIVGQGQGVKGHGSTFDFPFCSDFFCEFISDFDFCVNEGVFFGTLALSLVVVCVKGNLRLLNN